MLPKDQALTWTFVFPLMLALTLTCLFYILSIRMIKARRTSKNVIMNLYKYSFTHFFTIGPLLIADLFTLWFTIPDEVVFVTRTLMGLADLADAMIYYFQRRSSTGEMSPTRNRLVTLSPQKGLMTSNSARITKDFVDSDHSFE